MKRTKLGSNDRVLPDCIRIRMWGYHASIIKEKVTTFSFDGEKIYVSPTLIHNTAHKNLGTHDLLDFRYWNERNLLSVWIYDKSLIVQQLKQFERVYRNGDWKPFNIDTVELIFVSNGYAVKCLFSELDNFTEFDENSKFRAYHIMPPSLKRLVVDKDWRREYFKEGERSWVMKHGNIDPALWHLIMYEE